MGSAQTKQIFLRSTSFSPHLSETAKLYHHPSSAHLRREPVGDRFSPGELVCIYALQCLQTKPTRFMDFLLSAGTSLVACWVKNLPVTQETQETRVQSSSWEDPLEEEIATHSSILTGRIPWTEEPGGLQPRVTQSWT